MDNKTKEMMGEVYTSAYCDALEEADSILHALLKAANIQDKIVVDVISVWSDTIKKYITDKRKEIKNKKTY